MEMKLSPTHCKSEENTTSADPMKVKYEEDDPKGLVKLEKETDEQPSNEKKPGKLFARSKKISKNKPVERHNADKFVKFFKKWKELKKINEDVKQQTKFWFSSFNKKLNKTYIYRDFLDSVRIHFRLAINPQVFNFDAIKLQEDWSKLFLNLTDYLRNEVFELEGTVNREKKSQVVPVWIEGLNSFKIEEFQKYS